MKNPRLANRYAQSLLELAVERNQLEDITQEVRGLHQLIVYNRELLLLLRSPIVKADRKQSILNAILEGKIDPMLMAFVQLITAKGRENVLDEILEAYAQQYDVLKGVNKIKLTTATSISESLQQSILDNIRRNSSLEHIELETAINEDLIGGYVLELKDYLVDASLKRELELVKRQFVSNEYLFNIR
jgi:F-type H+-transporting ATPase subunit delta